MRTSLVVALLVAFVCVASATRVAYVESPMTNTLSSQAGAGIDYGFGVENEVDLYPVAQSQTQLQEAINPNAPSLTAEQVNARKEQQAILERAGDFLNEYDSPIDNVMKRLEEHMVLHYLEDTPEALAYAKKMLTCEEGIAGVACRKLVGEFYDCSSDQRGAKCRADKIQAIRDYRDSQIRLCGGSATEPSSAPEFKECRALLRQYKACDNNSEPEACKHFAMLLMRNEHEARTSCPFGIRGEECRVTIIEMLEQCSANDEECRYPYQQHVKELIKVENVMNATIAANPLLGNSSLGPNGTYGPNPNQVHPILVEVSSEVEVEEEAEAEAEAEEEY